jgi:tetratricopeptide (TPR) repeat protein
MDEKSSSAHNNLGLSFFESARYDDAITHYGKAIQNDKMNNKSVLYNNRGLAYYHSRKLMEAKKDFDDAIELDPHDSTIFFNRGNAFLNWEP